MATILLNKTKRAQGPFNLPHAQFCADGTCRCALVPMRVSVRTDEGGIGYRDHQQRVCASVFFLPGEAKGLAETALTCPEIEAAIRRGELEKRA